MPAPITAPTPSSTSCLAVSGLCYVGITQSAFVNSIVVAIKVTVIVLFVAFAARYVNPDNWVPFIPENEGPGRYGIDGIIRGASVVFFAYIGFDAVSTAAQEAKNPQRDMPIGILGSLFICTLIYIAMSAVLTGIMPVSTALIRMYSTVQIASEPRMPMGMSRCGFLASPAAVETASKPM